MFAKIISFIMSVIMFLGSFVSGLGSDVIIYRDMPYGTDAERQILDMNIPKSVKGEANMILFIHGGAWCEGSKNDYRPTLNEFAKQGIICAAINYRYCGEPNNATIYDIMDDISVALKKIKTIAKLNGIDLKGVMLDGGSAGAHLSLMYAYSKADEAPVTPVAVIARAPATDFTDMTFYDGSLHKIDPDKWYIPKKEWCTHLSFMTGEKITRLNLKRKTDVLYDISPIKYVNENSVPTIIAHGTKDTVLPYANSVALDKKLTEYGVEHEFITYNGAWHGLQDCPEGDAAFTKVYQEYIQKYVVR